MAKKTVQLHGEQQAVELQRAAIAEEIHDSLIPYLFATRMRLESLVAKLQDPEFPADGQTGKVGLACNEVAKAVESLHIALAISRQLTGQLYPPDLDSESWSDHLGAALSRESREGTRLIIDGDFDTLNSNRECRIAARRIAQESIRNAVKHGRATSVRVLVEACDENQLRLSISDNGCGFDTSSAKRGYGLRIMQSRADLVSASFKVNSALGGPTTVTVEFNRYDVAAAD